jgi:protein phosphatase 1 regulatory subunit 37
MTPAGAIALAEFLAESMSLFHLDLTMNSLDIAIVMALSSGLKANHVMRCLDVNIPPGDEEFTRSVFFYSFFFCERGTCIDLGGCA